MRRLAIFTGAMALAGLLASATVQAHSAPHASSAVKDGRVQTKGEALALDEAVFWDGGQLDGMVAAAQCDASKCGLFQLNIAHGGARLRVGIDTAMRSDTFVIEVVDAGGAIVGSATNSNQFNSEALIDHPAGGDYLIRVRPDNVKQAIYRMRAKLESSLPEDLPASAERVPMLPNLRTVPPIEFGFIAPANPLNGLYPPDTINPPLDIAGIHPLSCTADEMAPVALGGGAAKKCLRFTSGPINMGPGIYDMRFNMLPDLVAGTAHLAPQELLSRIVIGPMEQAVHYSDGSIEYRPAGTYSFHPIHGHFHDDYVLSFRLYAVTEEKAGGMKEVGIGTKSGFCPADQLWGDWYAFNQGYEVPGGDTIGGNCSSPANGVMGLSIGWGDVYRWQRPGMYVEFGGQGDGRYVVQSRVDEKDAILETDETDNVSYAYVEIKGEDVTILERGWGESPWDAHKAMFAGAGPAQREIVDVPQSSEDVEKKSGSFGGAMSLPSLLAMLLLAGGTAILPRGKRRRRE